MLNLYSLRPSSNEIPPLCNVRTLCMLSISTRSYSVLNMRKKTVAPTNDMVFGQRNSIGIIGKFHAAVTKFSQFDSQIKPFKIYQFGTQFVKFGDFLDRSIVFQDKVNTFLFMVSICANSPMAKPNKDSAGLNAHYSQAGRRIPKQIKQATIPRRYPNGYDGRTLCLFLSV